LIAAACAILATAPHVRAATTQPAQAGDELSIYLITMEPGDEIFEKFGHNAILVHDAAAGADDLFNYGVFTFENNFFYRFLKGDLDYWIEDWPAREALEDYAAHNRSIWQQELNLTPAQRVKLRDFLVWNAKDENKFYRYNYYTDNCSTRVRDAIDNPIGGQIKAQLQPLPTGTTFRWHTRRLTQVEPVWYTALNTVLGPGTDRPISQWEESFLPLKLMDHLRHVTIKSADGNDVPLIKSERTLFTSTRAPEPTKPPTWWPWYLLIGLIVDGVLILLGRMAPRSKWARRGFGIAATTYAAILAFCGWFGLWGWFFTSHWAAWRNENLFGYSPAALPLAFTIPLVVAMPKMGRKKPRGVVRLAVVCAFVVAASTILGVIVSVMLPQRIAEPMALVLPINVGLALALFHYAKAHPPSDPQRAS
jgi:hypothetical protein